MTLTDRIEEIATLIAEVANGNFDYKMEISESGDEMDAVINGVNMLGQELKNSTVSRDYMQSILQGIVDMLLILDFDFNIKTVNQALEKMTGYQEAELRGTHFAQLIQKEDNPLLLPQMEQFRKKGSSLNVELVMTSKDGNKFPTSCSLSYLRDKDRKINGILIIAKDITAIKNTERELHEAKEKAEAASEAKTNFLSNMSHEIRTPLNGIMGFTDLLMQSDLDEAQQKYLDLIKTSGTALTKLLNDILDLHRIEKDKITIEHVPFDYLEVISTNLEPYKFLAEGKKITFSNFFDDSIPDQLIGDSDRINQIIVNLVSNAIKFTEKGSITIHHKAEPIDSETISLKFEVTDTGPGITKEKQALIFDPFTQSDESITRKFGGSGLGLTICKKLLEVMGGKLGVHSPVYDNFNGTTFWFTLPLKFINKKRTAKPVSNVSEFKLRENVKILVADDNLMNTVLMHDMLKGLGAEVTTVENGKEAVEQATSGNFDMVFMDIQMPVMNGMEATEILRNSNIEIPIIAFSAAAYKEDIKKGMASGMSDYFCKPFTYDELKSLLQKWV